MLEKNTNLVIGKTNTGKTKGILFKEVEKAMNNNENLFILDNKGEYYRTFGGALKENGYDVYVINFENPINSNTFNPLMLPYNLYTNDQKDNALNCIEIITKELFKEENINSSADPFWNAVSSDYVTGLILFLLRNANENEINFGSIGTLLSQVGNKYKDTTLFKEYLNTISSMDNIYISVSPVTFAPPETKESIISIVRQKLNTLFMRENLLNIISKNELDLNNLSDKTAIFVIGNNTVLNMLFEQLLFIIRNKKLEFNLILDNFDLYSRFTGIKDLIEKASFYNTKVNVAVRDIEEMEEKYGKFLFNHFENVINTPLDNIDLYEIGNYDIYPKVEQIENTYFNLEKFVKKNEQA